MFHNHLYKHLPSSLSINPTPWKKPLYLGVADLWSLMNFTLTVSIGVTAKMASQIPAPSPQNILLSADKLPRSSTARFLNVSKAPNLTALLGMLP